MPRAPGLVKAPRKQKSDVLGDGSLGRVLTARSNLILVDVAGNTVECTLRGRLRQATRAESCPAVVGDRVRVTLTDDGTGVVEEILARDTVLGRARTGKAPQVIAANVDQAMIVFAAALPDPDAYMLYQLDKMLVQAQAGKLAPLICCNKIDLRPESRDTFNEYARLGFPVVYTSAVTGDGLEELRARLAGKVSVLCGPSGVGKSSLINALQPGMTIRVGDVSDWTGKGRHTTSASEMYPLGPDTWIVDTAGIRRLDLWKVPKDQVDQYFPEYDDLWERCDDPNCNHHDEPGCAVREAVERGDRSRRRYESYRSIVEGR